MNRCECGGILITESSYTDFSCYKNIPFWGSLTIRQIEMDKIGRVYCIECKKEVSNGNTR